MSGETVKAPARRSPEPLYAVVPSLRGCLWRNEIQARHGRADNRHDATKDSVSMAPIADEAERLSFLHFRGRARGD